MTRREALVRRFLEQERSAKRILADDREALHAFLRWNILMLADVLGEPIRRGDTYGSVRGRLIDRSGSPEAAQSSANHSTATTTRKDQS